MICDIFNEPLSWYIRRPKNFWLSPLANVITSETLAGSTELRLTVTNEPLFRTYTVSETPNP